MHRSVRIGLGLSVLVAMVAGALLLLAGPGPIYTLGDEFEGLEQTQGDRDFARYGECGENEEPSSCASPLIVITLGDAPCPAATGPPRMLPGGAAVTPIDGGGGAMVLTGDEVVLVRGLDTDQVLRAARELRREDERLPPPSARNRCRTSA